MVNDELLGKMVLASRTCALWNVKFDCLKEGMPSGLWTSKIVAVIIAKQYERKRFGSKTKLIVVI